MAYEKKDGDLVLFQNNRRKSDKEPTMRGDLLLNGVTYEVACWTKLDRNGDKFLTGRAQVKQPRNGPKSNLTEADVTDSDVPF